MPLRGDVFFLVVGRLAPGVSIDRARVEIGAINARLDAEYPGSGRRDTGVFVLRDVVLGDYRLALWTLLGAVGVLLVIACANVANLLLGRGIDREKELAVRSAMGASRLVLARQLTAESLLLALTAGVVGAFVSYPGIRAIRDLGLIDIPRIEGASLDLRVLLFTLGVSVVTGLVAGVLPALRGSRVDLAASLKGGGQAAASLDRRTLRELLLVGEGALALVLIIAAGLLVRSFVALRTFDWGFDPKGAVAISVRFPESLRAASIGQKVDFVDRALTGLARVPGVRSASVGRIAPLAGYSYGRGYTLAIDGQLAGQASIFEITHGYFDTLGTRILEGREFQHDQRNGVPEVVLGAGLASRLFPDGAVGRTLELVVLRANVSAALGALPDEEARQAEADPANWEYRQHTVVGVVQDVRMFNWDIEGSAVYTDVRRDTLLRDSPMEGMWTPNQFVLRTDADLDAVVGPARAALLEAEPGLTFDRVASLEDAAARAIGGAGSNRLLLLVSIAFGTLSLALAAIGIYGVMAHMVSRRTYEIGVRMALGADRASVVRLVLRRSLRLTALGLALGLTAAWAVTRVLASLLFGVSPTDPATFGSLAIVLLVVAAAASAVPACPYASVRPSGVQPTSQWMFAGFRSRCSRSHHCRSVGNRTRSFTQGQSDGAGGARRPTVTRIALARATGASRVLAAFPERESALASPYSAPAALYRSREPVLRLRPAEQAPLTAALDGETDAEPSASLQRRWVNAFRCRSGCTARCS